MLIQFIFYNFTNCYIFIRVIELMELDYKKIGIRIKEERLNRNISQEKLAELINMSKEHVSHIECVMNLLDF